MFEGGGFGVGVTVTPLDAQPYPVELLPPGVTARATWEGEVAQARTDCSTRDLDATSPFMGGQVTLRWIYNHMIGEYAGHAGHADLLRERIDGTTGV